MHMNSYVIAIKIKMYVTGPLFFSVTRTLYKVNVALEHST